MLTLTDRERAHLLGILREEQARVQVETMCVSRHTPGYRGMLDDIAEDLFNIAAQLEGEDGQG